MKEIINPEQQLQIIQVDGLDADQFIDFYQKRKPEIEGRLLKTGALKFKDVAIESMEEFQYIISVISDRFLNYIDGNSPRTKLSDHVYTSTEYDNTQKITMHNELSYSAKWPGKIFFSCLQPAQSGGETLLADSREILRNMPVAIRENIASKGIIYIRNLHAGYGIGPSWKSTFETDRKDVVEKYFYDYGMDYEWRPDESVRIKQRSKGIIQHRITGEAVWFNQIDQFHPIQLGEEAYEAVSSIYDKPEDFPTYVTYGDGSVIGDDAVKSILHAIEEVTFAPPWQRNELLIVDNELYAHGRNPFEGARKVLVAMSA
jgi:alpha-ketoglutarate-dependent taurine dioxygenase